MKNILLFIIGLFSYLSNSAQARKDLNIDYMLRGYIYASSAIEDTLSPGGFGGSDNLPKQVDSLFYYSGRVFFLKIDTSNLVVFGENYNGYKLYIVNRTDSTILLAGTGSRLNVIAEAFINNKWQPIEYFPRSWCGNSYHTIYLKPNQFWEFVIPKYKGKMNVKIRYRLKLGNSAFLYSNEILGSINKNQLNQKQGHKESGIMDPYNE